MPSLKSWNLASFKVLTDRQVWVVLWFIDGRRHLASPFTLSISMFSSVISLPFKNDTNHNKGQLNSLTLFTYAIGQFQIMVIHWYKTNLTFNFSIHIHSCPIQGARLESNSEFAIAKQCQRYKQIKKKWWFLALIWSTLPRMGTIIWRIHSWDTSLPSYQ